MLHRGASLNSAQGILLHHVKIDFVADKVPDVVDTVLDHSRPLQTQAPGDHINVLGEPHGEQHLGSEHPGVADLHPLGQALVVAEYLHAGLRVRVVGGLEPELLYPELSEELIQDPDEVTQGQAPVTKEN